jgi:hypothetical protein
MNNIFTRIKEFFKGDDKDSEYRFIPQIEGIKQAYIRGNDDIVFKTDYDEKKLLAFDILIYQQAHHAFVHIFYSVRGNDLRQTLEDGFYNADNGRIFVTFFDNELKLTWDLGSGVALGDYEVTMITISKDDTKIRKGKITIWQKNDTGSLNNTTVKTA